MRNELKYLVPEDLLPTLRRRIEPFVELDVYGRGYEDCGYTVRSIYFDTPGLAYYHEKQASLRDRKKLRIRAYNQFAEESPTFLEIKRKSEAAVWKNRARLPFSKIEALLESGDVERYFDENTFRRGDAQRFLFHVYRYSLRPTSLVVYEREAFVGRFDPTLRITFDRNLRGRAYPQLDQLFQEDDLKPTMTRHFILEVKYDSHFPRWLWPILGEWGLLQQALSKYCMAVDITNRDADGKATVISQSDGAGRRQREMPAEQTESPIAA